MAGGNLTPRQKMINLMYLVFIAMLAMNMDKKVLTNIGLGIEDNKEANVRLTETNNASLTELQRLAAEQPEKYADKSKAAQELSSISNEFNAYLDTVQEELTATLEDPSDYEKMDSRDAGDHYFFKGEKYTPKGEEFVSKISNYRESVLKILGPKGNPDIIKSVKKRFNTADDVAKNGKPVKWLISRFEGYPLVTTLSNISRMQAGIKATEAESYGSIVKGQMTSDVSMTNYDAMVIFDKNAYYPGEKLSGKIVLGKNDPTLKASRVVVNGRKIANKNIKAGQVILDGGVGSVGDHDLKGEFVFLEDGKEVSIPIKGSYAVIPKPNSAVIAADKMNVVYRSLPNPMTISIPGIPNNKVTASGNGLRRGNGSGKWIMTPGSGREVKITASGKLPSGENVSSSQTFRIKDIPKPLATVRKESGYVKMPKSSLAKTTVRVELPDFLFDLKFRVKSFSIKVPGKGTIRVSGSKMNGAAQTAIKGARVGDLISIFDVKSSLEGVSGVNVKNATAVTIELQ